jgi:hypothetical protein
MTTTAKQVTAWMEKQPDAIWMLLHLHETYIEGHHEESNVTIIKQLEPIPDAPWKTSTTVASRRRHIATEILLGKFNAKPLLSWNGTLVGISIAGWDIGTSQGPIGDQAWFQQALEELEPLAQYKLTMLRENRARQLVLPEMVFSLVHVVLERRQRGDLFVSWDAMDALKEWGEAHQAIPLPDTTPYLSTNQGNRHQQGILIPKIIHPDSGQHRQLYTEVFWWHPMIQRTIFRTANNDDDTNYGCG